MDFLEYCERLKELWISKELEEIKDLGFEPDFIPEPFFVLEKGKNPLFILNNNPGKGLDVQRSESFSDLVSRGAKYTEYSESLSLFYNNNRMHNSLMFRTIGKNAESRNNKMKAYSRELGFDGVCCVETIPFHSSKLPNKNKILHDCLSKKIFIEYFHYLKEYLRDKPSLIISCNNSDDILEASLVNGWTSFQMQLVSMSLTEATYYETCKKNGKATGILIMALRAIVWVKSHNFMGQEAW